MAAIITSTVAPVAHPITGASRGVSTGTSRDDLYLGDTVTLNSASTATTYAWTLVYVPEGSVAALSGDPTQQSPGVFTLDLEGPYLVRLTVDLGLPTESTQLVRVRWLTEFGQLKIVAAGEENNSGIPIPVDQTADGWTNDQNSNLFTINEFVSRVSASGRIIYVDQNGTTTDTIRGFGQYDAVQDAIDEAVTNTPSSSEPWLVAIRPGLFTEDIILAPHVHLYGWPGSADGDDNNRVVRIRNSSVAVDAALPLAGDHVFLAGITFENPNTGTEPAIDKTGPGTLHIYRCGVTNQGTSASQGPALRVAGGIVETVRSRFILNPSAGAAQPAVLVTGGAGSAVNYQSCQVSGPSGMAMEVGTAAYARDSQFTGSGASPSTAGIVTEGSSLTLEYCRVASAVTNPLQAHPAGGVLADDLSLAVRWTRVEGGILFDDTGVTGTTTLQLGAVEYTTLTVNGTPDTDEATVKSRTNYYDPTATSLVATNVQDAIDELEGIATAVQTLDEAYDAGLGAGGTGRIITADSGAVRIIGAGTPTDPPVPASTDGGLELTGTIYVGAIGDPEISFDPNPFGNGALIRMGRFIAAGNAPFGSTVGILARSTGTPDFNNYNLRLQSESSSGGSLIGRVIVRGGDGLDNGGSTPLGASVYIQGGNTNAGALDAGDVFLAPGDAPGAGSPGSVVLVRPEDATAATLTAVGAFVGGVTGTVRFATDMGAIEVGIDAGDGLAAVLALFNATEQVAAVDSGGGVLELTTASTGPNAEIYYLNDTVGGTLDTALGVFDGQAQVSGTWPSSILLQVSANNEITIGFGGAAGPLIYNSATGKLTVPGVIDPTAVIFDEAPPIAAGAAKGVIFTGDGTGGSTQGSFYFRHESAAIQDISAAVVAAAAAFATAGTGLTASGNTVNAIAGDASITMAANDFRVNLDATGGANLASTLKLTANGLALGVDDVTVEESAAGGVLRAKDLGISTAKLANNAVTVAKINLQFREEVFNDTGWSAAGGGEFQRTLAAVPLNGVQVDFYGQCFRNGLAEMTNTGSGVAATTLDEYRILDDASTGRIRIGFDPTASGNIYVVRYVSLAV